MTCSAQKLKIVGLAIAIVVLGGIASVSAQEKIAPLSDYQYKKDYPQFEAIKKEADVQKRADALLAFVKERGISKMLLYAANDYMACVKPQMDKKDWAKAISMTESFLALVPTADAAKAADPTRSDEFIKDILVPTQKLLLSSLVTTYYQAQNWPKAAEMAEKTYELAPDKALLPVIADIYSKFNADKYLVYGQKILAEFPMEQSYATALQMAQAYIQKQDAAAATDMLTKVMDVYGDKVPPNVPEAQWNATRAFAYGVIAGGVYGKKEYAKALELYEKVAKFDSTRDDAYYYIGMSKWQSQDPQGAIEAFAKCVVLNKSFAKKAQGYLEQLYKARNKDTLDGLDQLLGKAKADLGVK
jgi:tetratricopeptide (TPR) repeat protein